MQEDIIINLSQINILEDKNTVTTKERSINWTKSKLRTFIYQLTPVKSDKEVAKRKFVVTNKQQIFKLDKEQQCKDRNP